MFKKYLGGITSVPVACFIVSGEERIPAPEGTHEMGGDYQGISIITDADGIVTEIISEVAEETPEETPTLIPSTQSSANEATTDQIPNAKAKGERTPEKGEQSKNLSNRTHAPTNIFASHLKMPRKMETITRPICV